ncbi:uncharacterized protein LOC124162069 [Ischnura elegans]|uniref:uncharacterized protein LOC124162069 n=1 Tax=Ischnura elegans TaxID=197161 RepID=UPI001ED89B91|nr:uncharacterized protein LOC124162069 [Ischnura elegans]
MVRNYARVVGGRRSHGHDNQQIEKAVEAVKSGRMSLRGACKEFGVPKSTVHDILKDKHPKKSGGQTVLSAKEEDQLAQGILKCAEWGIPLRAIDLRLVVREYLNRMGRKEKVFKDNFPGMEWVRGFLSRRRELTVRLGENIKRVRAAVTREVLEKYFNNLEVVLNGVPPENIVNYDETNFSDDPGKSRVIVKRGEKHPSVIKDTSKTSVSVMIAASASGELLPPYTVYKAVHLYPTWVEGGIEGSRFNRNISGWFDITTFEDWFTTTCVPFFKNRQGPKVMIGDNLSSHLSVEVIRKCEEMGIDFVMLPPNSTHLCQPLDVAFFRPLKIAWRKCLDQWKRKNRGVLPKSGFPRLLKSAFESMGSSLSPNICAGFRATGIFPFDKSRVISKVPSLNPKENSDAASDAWSNAFLEMLASSRAETPEGRKSRGKKLNVEAGKSVSAEIKNESVCDDVVDISSEKNLYVDEVLASHVNNEVDFEIPGSLTENSFVLLKFGTNKRDRLFVGKVIEVCSNKKIRVQCLRKKNTAKETYFRFPDVADECIVGKSQIVRQLAPPRDLRRGRFVFSSLSDVNDVD